MEFIPGMQGIFNPHTTISVMQHISKLKNKTLMTLSTDAETAFDKFNMYKKDAPDNLNITKTIYDKTTVNIILSGERLIVFPVRSGTKQGCPLSPLLFNRVLEVLVKAGKEMEIKGI